MSDDQQAEVETWESLILVTTDCFTCGAVGVEQGVNAADRPRARRWARAHVQKYPGHHVAVETTLGRSYRTEGASHG